MTGTSVAAVVVTYNRANKLSKVLDAILAQDTKPDAIFVIDNASSDNTSDVIAGKNSLIIEHIQLPENIGGAGGFHEGMKIGYDEGYDFLWIMDDDCYAEPDALALLQEGLKKFEDSYVYQPSFACSAVKWTDRSLCEMNTPSPVWDWPRFYSSATPYFLVDSCSFVSVLIPRWAIATHGLPIKEYFIWHDDVEYTQRLAQTYPGIYCPESIVIHDTPENIGVNFGLITKDNLWKFRYGARNQSSFRWERNGIYGTLYLLRMVHIQMRDGNVPTKLRLKIYKDVIQGIFFKPTRIKV